MAASDAKKARTGAAPGEREITVQGADKPLQVTVLRGAARSPIVDALGWAPGKDEAVAARVDEILKKLETGREAACLEYCSKLDGFDGMTAKDGSKTVLLTKEQIEEQTKDLPEQAKKDIKEQLDRIKKFAVAQKNACQSFETEVSPGVTAGQTVLPLESAGCYCPGGRYSHVSSAVMTVGTAKVAGVPHVVAASPPLRGTGKIHPATLYAMKEAGADSVLVCGGAQAIAALAFGLFTNRPADIIVGPGNSYVAEAKRTLYGSLGIDMFAGPTEILVLADETADAEIVATDLVSQAEHGPTSPAWLITTSMELAKKVEELVPQIMEKFLPKDNAAFVSWPECGEIVVVKDRQDMMLLSDHYAAEHLEVHCKDLDWWKANLKHYGSLFLGEETNVTYGDKCSGPNHALPTLRAARYTGGLSVDKFVKKLTWQKMDKDSGRVVGPLAARISRLEGMEGHALSADVRMKKYFPGEKFDLACPK